MFKLCIALAAVVAIAAGKPNWPLYPAVAVPSYVGPVAATYSAYPVAAAPVAPAHYVHAPYAAASYAPGFVAAPVAAAPLAPAAIAAPVAAHIPSYSYSWPAYGYGSPYLIKK